jgi:hypothetical protein
MPMNIEERNVMSIVNLSRIIENSLKYVENPTSKSFVEEERVTLYKALKGLTGKGTPFFENCARNGEFGKELMEDMTYYIEDVYSKDGRIVHSDLQGKVSVETSLVVELFTTIVKLRARLEIFCDKGAEFLKGRKQLDPEIEKLIQDDKRYFHAYAGKLSAVLLANKANEANATVAAFAKSYSKEHGNIDPRKDPEFKPDQDPSVRMVRNEFHELNEDMVMVLNSYGEQDPDFRFARENTYHDCQIFNGQMETTNPEQFFQLFTSYFNDIIGYTGSEVNTEFRKVSDEIQAFDKQYLEDLKKAQEKKAEASEASKEK